MEEFTRKQDGRLERTAGTPLMMMTFVLSSDASGTCELISPPPKPSFSILLSKTRALANAKLDLPSFQSAFSTRQSRAPVIAATCAREQVSSVVDGESGYTSVVVR